jgi:TPR repeat protein
MYYRKGRYIEAEKYFVEGASKQDAPSMYWLATLYLTQSNDAAKHAKARMLLEEAIRCGSVHAKHGLGLLYMKGQFGIKYVLRGLWLFLAGIVDAFRVTYRDPLSRRLW